MLEHERKINVITSAPNQNREHFSDHLERLVPYFAARSLNRVVAVSRGVETLSIDMWNSFGHHMDQGYKKQVRFDGASREEYSKLLIDEKYRFLEGIGIDVSSNEIVRDDDPDTIDWVENKLGRLLDEGVIYEDTESVSVCSGCGNIIAAATSNVSTCSRCDGVDIRVEKRNVLFLDLPGDRLRIVRNRVDLPRKAGFINGQFATLPGRVMIARNRDYGQPLGIPGYEDMVLDPKIGLALMPEMVAEKYGIDVLTQVQGATTAKNTTPYTCVLSPELSARYIFTSNIPPNVDERKLSELGVDFFTKYLPIHMLDRSSNLDVSQLQALSIEHSKVKRKIENATHYLESNLSEALSESPLDSTRVVAAMGSVAAYDIRRGVLEMRKYVYEDLGGRYVQELREHGRGLSLESIQSINSILNEVF